MQLKFYTLDVFTEQRFGGNPLAVVLNADALPAGLMQTIAGEL
jgi:trans-2,3-dihydro-3-hydroxyanthranilate isomerase